MVRHSDQEKHGRIRYLYDVDWGDPALYDLVLNTEKLSVDAGGRLTLEKGDDPKDLRKALKAAASTLNRRIRFPFRGEDGSLSFYLEGKRGRRGRRPKAEAGAPKRRGRPRKASA